MSTDQTPPNRWSILVGINFYADIPGQKSPTLLGAVSDVNKVERYLKDTLKFEDSHILKLTSTAPPEQDAKEPQEPPENRPTADNIISPPEQDAKEPQEPPENRPTADNIICAFKHVIKEAKAGDLFHFHYSGHGVRAKTQYPKRKGRNGFDEALVPWNVGCGGRYLLDVEVARLLDCLVKKGVVMTVVFDCCYSGSVSRARESGMTENLIVRGLEDDDDRVLDTTPRDTHSDPFTHESQSGNNDTNEVDSSWILKSGGYELLAACGADEQAHELVNPSAGALTTFLMETLETAGPTITHGMLFRKLKSKIRNRLPQTPVFVGNKKRLFFGKDEAADINTIAVMFREGTIHNPEEYCLRAGHAHGVTKGSEFALYPWNATVLREENAISKVRITEVRDAESVVEFVEGAPTILAEDIRNGYQAVLSKLEVQNKLLVHLKSSTERLHQHLRAQLEISSVFGLASEHQLANYSIDVDLAGRLILLDAHNEPIPNFPSSDDSDSLLSRLTHLVKYQIVSDLKNSDSTIRYSFRIDKQSISMASSFLTFTDKLQSATAKR
jgi:hypothetical protein